MFLRTSSLKEKKTIDELLSSNQKRFPVPFCGRISIKAELLQKMHWHCGTNQTERKARKEACETAQQHPLAYARNIHKGSMYVSTINSILDGGTGISNMHAKQVIKANKP